MLYKRAQEKYVCVLFFCFLFSWVSIFHTSLLSYRIFFHDNTHFFFRGPSVSLGRFPMFHLTATPSTFPHLLQTLFLHHIHRPQVCIRLYKGGDSTLKRGRGGMKYILFLRINIYQSLKKVGNHFQLECVCLNRKVNKKGKFTSYNCSTNPSLSSIIHVMYSIGANVKHLKERICY